MDISRFDDSILGRLTPDPLQFAFSGKKSAHAGRGGRPILEPVQQQAMFSGLLRGEPEPGRARCLYLHIPFCRVRCTFCSFFQYAASPAWIENYLQQLWREMEAKAAMPWVQAAPFDAVYIGGGTPTDMTAPQVRELGNRLRRLFPLSHDCELTLEGRLNGFDEEKYQAALEGGFNRFSFGVQSFDTKVRRAAKRLDEREQVLQRLSELTRGDEAPIILDLLFGLPYQDEACWQRDIADFLDSGAHGVDLYQLIEMQGTPMARLVEQGKQPPPAETPLKARLYGYGATTLEQAGLTRLSSCHWARDPRERSRYNALAKTSADVLPLGAGAGGSIQGISVMQHRELEPYQAACESGQWPVAMMMAAAPHYQRDGLLKSAFDKGCLDARVWRDEGEPELFASLMPLLQAWQERGLLTLQGNKAELTLAGRFWNVNLAQAALMALSPPQAAQMPPAHFQPSHTHSMEKKHVTHS